ncbi:MAG: hypothetical protein JKY49_00240 [Cohaesibacteraceae bacterium]|nr:hypothetical protein [Cohaesibacteraceae bacterium]
MKAVIAWKTDGDQNHLPEQLIGRGILVEYSVLDMSSSLKKIVRLNQGPGWHF